MALTTCMCEGVCSQMEAERDKEEPRSGEQETRASLCHAFKQRDKYELQSHPGTQSVRWHFTNTAFLIQEQLDRS